MVERLHEDIEGHKQPPSIFGLGWKDHTKVKDISSLLVLYEIYLIIFKD